MYQLIARDRNVPTASALVLCFSHTFFFRKLKNEKIHKLISFFDIFFHNLICLFLVPVPARTSAHAQHVLAFVVSFSSSNYLDNN